MDIARYIITFIAIVVLSVAAAWWRRHRATRQAASLAAGEAVRVRAWLRAASDPYPRSARRGVFVLGHGLVWVSRFGEIPLSLRVTRVSAAKRGVCITGVDAAGVVVDIEVDAERAEMIVEAARSSNLVPARAASYRERWTKYILLWPLIMLALGLAWAMVWSWLWFGGETRVATVRSNDDETCDVLWRAGDRTETAEVDCNDENPGDVVSVRVLRAPLDGEAVDLEFSPVVLLTVGLGLTSAGMVGVGVRAVRELIGRRAASAARLANATVDFGDFETSSLTQPAVAQAAERRGSFEGWIKNGVTTAHWTGGGITRFLNSWRFIAASGGFAALVGLWDPVGSLAIAVATIAVLVVPSIWRRRAERTALNGPAQGASFVLLRGHNDEPLLLLYRATDSSPWAGAELRRPLEVGIPIAGDCRLFEEAPRVVVVANRPLSVSRFGEIEDLDFVRSLVSANVLDAPLLDED